MRAIDMSPPILATIDESTPLIEAANRIAALRSQR